MGGPTECIASIEDLMLCVGDECAAWVTECIENEDADCECADSTCEEKEEECAAQGSAMCAACETDCTGEGFTVVDTIREVASRPKMLNAAKFVQGNLEG